MQRRVCVQMLRQQQHLFDGRKRCRRRGGFLQNLLLLYIYVYMYVY